MIVENSNYLARLLQGTKELAYLLDHWKWAHVWENTNFFFFLKKEHKIKKIWKNGKLLLKAFPIRDEIVILSLSIYRDHLAGCLQIGKDMLEKGKR